MAYLHDVKGRLHAFIARLHGAWTHRIMLRHFYTVLQHIYTISRHIYMYIICLIRGKYFKFSIN